VKASIILCTVLAIVSTRAWAQSDGASAGSTSASGSAAGPSGSPAEGAQSGGADTAASVPSAPPTPGPAANAPDANDASEGEHIGARGRDANAPAPHPSDDAQSIEDSFTVVDPYETDPYEDPNEHVTAERRESDADETVPLTPRAPGSAVATGTRSQAANDSEDTEAPSAENDPLSLGREPSGRDPTAGSQAKDADGVDDDDALAPATRPGHEAARADADDPYAVDPYETDPYDDDAR
jgi:hypothetical protein